MPCCCHNLIIKLMAVFSRPAHETCSSVKSVTSFMLLKGAQSGRGGERGFCCGGGGPLLRWARGDGSAEVGGGGYCYGGGGVSAEVGGGLAGSMNEYCKAA